MNQNRKAGCQTKDVSYPWRLWPATKFSDQFRRISFHDDRSR